MTQAKLAAVKNAKELQDQVDIIKIKYSDKLGIREEIDEANE